MINEKVLYQEKMKTILHLFLLLTLAQPVWSQEEIPFKIISNRPIIEVNVNDTLYTNFCIDLGATGVGRLDDSVVNNLDLKVTGQISNYDGISTQNYDQVGPVTVSFAGVEYQDIGLMTRDYSPRHGLLGRGFFQNKLLTIDYLTENIIVEEGALKSGDPHVVDLEPPFDIKARIGKVEGLFHIDTGSSLPLMVPTEFLEKHNIKYENTGNVYNARRANTVHEIIEAKLMEEVEIAGIVLKDHIIMHSDMVNQINLGGETLRNFKLTVDQKNKLVRFINS